MRLLTARRLALVALAPALLLFSAVPGCSNESEGERCGDDPSDVSKPGTPNDDDCSSPLICVAANLLVSSQANRCCNPNPNIANDSRCLRGTGTAPGIDAGSGGSATSGGTGGTGGTTAGGSGGTGDAAAAGAADMSTGGA